MKKGIKITIIVLALAIVGLISYIIADKLIKPAITKSNGNTTNSVQSTTTSGDEQNSDVDAGKKIKEEIEKKEFLSKNGINESDVSSLEYRAVENGNNPIYIVSVSYMPEGQASNSKTFQVTYKDGKVSFDVIEEHKYMSDTISYDSSKKILKLSAAVRETSRDTFFTLSDGKFSQVDLAIKEGSKEYTFVELKSTKVDVNKKTTTNNSSTTNNKSTTKTDDSNNTSYSIGAVGKYQYFEKNSNYYHEAHFEIKKQTANSIEFELSAAHGSDVDHVNIGDLKGTAKKVDVPDDMVVGGSTQEAYQYTEEIDGVTNKVTFVYTAYRQFEYVCIKEEYPSGTNPYAGHNVYFEGDYEKVQ